MTTSISSTSKQNSRRVYLDFLRIIAIFMVLFNHTNQKGFMLFVTETNPTLRFFYLCNAIIIKIAVPIFFMISGALLLGKEESLSKVIRQKFLKFLGILIAASVISYLYTCLRIDHQMPSPVIFFKKLYTESLAGAYWYLYMYLAYILMLPLLRRLTAAMKNQDFIWLFAMYGLIEALSIADFLIFKGTASHNSNFNFFITSKYIIYPFLGYYLDQIMPGKYAKRRTIYVLAIMSIASIVICAILTEYRCALINEWQEDTCQTFFNTLIFIPSSACFLAAKMWFDRHQLTSKSTSLIKCCGALTFGIYLFERIYRRETLFIYWFLLPYLHSLPACLIWIFSACTIGALITLLLKKLPVIREYI